MHTSASGPAVMVRQGLITHFVTEQIRQTTFRNYKDTAIIFKQFTLFRNPIIAECYN